MIPVMQTRLHEPREGVTGNCFAACLASILECPLENVPSLESDTDSGWSEHWQRIGAFLVERGLAMIWISWPEDGPIHRRPWASTDALEVPGAYYIGSGTSPRGLDHSVVMQDGEIIHDPHPEGGGIDPLAAVAYLVSIKTGHADRVN